MTRKRQSAACRIAWWRNKQPSPRLSPYVKRMTIDVWPTLIFRTPKLSTCRRNMSRGYIEENWQKFAERFPSRSLKRLLFWSLFPCSARWQVNYSTQLLQLPSADWRMEGGTSDGSWTLRCVTTGRNTSPSWRLAPRYTRNLTIHYENHSTRLGERKMAIKYDIKHLMETIHHPSSLIEKSNSLDMIEKFTNHRLVNKLRFP